MLDIDLLFSFLLMGILFIRQVIIFKQPNKINYAPLLLGVGGIGTMTHLLLQPENEDFILLLRESMLPFFVGLILFIIMNIMRQTQQQQNTVYEHDFTDSLMDQVMQLKAYVGVLEGNQHQLHEQEDTMQHDMTVLFEKEIDALHVIQENQKGLIEQLSSIIDVQNESLKDFEDFTQREMPDLDNVIHRHIDMFRVAEQDHFNQIKQLVEGSEQIALGEKLDAFRVTIDHMAENNREAAKEMVAQASRETRVMLSDFSKQLTALRSQAEGIATSLSEDETMFQSLREQSQLVMKQMVLSAQQMNEISSDGERIRAIYEPLGGLNKEVVEIHDDYISARLQLETLAKTLRAVETDRLEKMQHYIEALGDQLDNKIGDSMDALHEHYHIAQKDISKSVKELSSRNRLQQSYQADA